MLIFDEPDLAWFADQAAKTVDAFPTVFQSAAKDVVIQIAEWPDGEMLADLGIREGRHLTGLYEGVPVTEKSVFEQPHAPDQVWLFRQPILLEWRERKGITLEALVAHVTVHEFAHHFGWSDEDIAHVDRWWE